MKRIISAVLGLLAPSLTTTIANAAPFEELSETTPMLPSEFEVVVRARDDQLSEEQIYELIQIHRRLHLSSPEERHALMNDLWASRHWSRHYLFRAIAGRPTLATS